MKNKRILAVFFSAVTAMSAVSPIISNALHTWGKVSSPDEFSDYENIDEKYPLKYLCGAKPREPYKPTDVFCDAYIDKFNKSNNYYFVYYLYHPHNYVKFNLSEVDENLEEKLKEIKDNGGIGKNSEGAYQGEFFYLTDEQAKKIRELLGDKVVDFTYYTDVYSYYRSDTYLTLYYYATDEEILRNQYNYCYNLIDNFNDTKNTIEKYIEENKIDAELIITPNGNEHPVEVIGSIKLELDTDIPIMEHFKIANDIYELTGLEPAHNILETNNASTSGTELNLTNYLNGDSNCDKKQSIADAVAILQFLGNPDDYPLSELGAFNADSDCNGITADDAVRIQQKDAGIL